mgnify:FL=1
MVMLKKKLRNVIKELLEEYPIIRDEDRRLVCNVWWLEMGGSASVKKLTAPDFMNKVANGSLSSWETITRIRRKLQEEIPDLRGKKWDSRHNQQVKVISELQEIAIDYSTPSRY